MIRKVLLLVLAALAILTGSLLAVAHYQNYQNKKVNAQVAAVQKLGNKVNELQATYEAKDAARVTAYNNLQAECTKGLAAYNALTITQKAKLSVPACGQAVH